MKTNWTTKETEVLITMRAKNEKLEVIARKLKKSLGDVGTKVSRELKTRKYEEWTPKEFEIAKNLLSLGLSYSEIGIILNRSRESVNQKFYEERKRNG